jgi:hypothetical protein
LVVIGIYVAWKDISDRLFESRLQLKIALFGFEDYSKYPVSIVSKEKKKTCL